MVIIIIIEGKKMPTVIMTEITQDGKEGAQDSNWDQAEKEASHKASGKNAIGGWGKPQNSWGFGKSSQNI